MIISEHLSQRGARQAEQKVRSSMNPLVEGGCLGHATILCFVIAKLGFLAVYQ